MRGRSGWLTLGAAAVFGVVVMAGEKAPDSYVKNMKDTNAAAASLRKNVEAKDYAAIAKDAATLKALFSSTEEFWTNRKADDAIAVAKTGVKAATDLEAAANAKNDADVSAAAKTLQGTCKTCHDAHRERLPDGTSEIK
jgi:cytochrome c556